MFAAKIKSDEDLDLLFGLDKQTVLSHPLNKNFFLSTYDKYSLTVQAGDSLNNLLLDWCKIYNNKFNESLRKKCPNPEILYPGTKIFATEKDFREKHNFDQLK